MRVTLIIVVAVIVVTTETYAKPCPKKEFWSSKLDRCLPCTKCKDNRVTLIPCQQHRDTICVPISDLKIDWSWLPTGKPPVVTDRKPDKVTFDDNDEDALPPLKMATHHRGSIDANILNNYGPVLRGDDTRTTVDRQNKLKPTPRPLYKKSKVVIDDSTNLEEKVHWKDEFFDVEKLLEDLESPEGKSRRKMVKFDNEQLERWLIRSQNKLKHKKDDLMKVLKEKKAEESGENGGGLRLNHPTATIVDDPRLLKRLLDHEMHTNKTRRLHKEEDHRRLTELEKLEKRLEKEELSATNVNFVDLVATKSKSKAGELEFKSAVPTHREHDSGREDTNGQVMKGGGMVFEKTIISVSNPTTSDAEERNDGVKKNVAVTSGGQFSIEGIVEGGNKKATAPFTAAERIVWDWQAVAFVSAVASCLLFFLVAAIYTIVNARQWRRIKKRYDTDLDEMSSRLALMGGIGHSSGGGNSGMAESGTVESSGTKEKYLQQLIAAQSFNERKSNLYIDDKLNS